MKRNTYLTDSTMRGWEFLTGDYDFVKFGGSWVKHLYGNKYHVIELINMGEAIGEENQPKYVVELKEVDTESHQLDQAIRSCGFPESFDFEANPMAEVESLSCYGAFAPMGDWAGNNYTALLKDAKRESTRLIKNLEYHRQQMNRPVNRIGSTAAEYQAGDMTSATIRGIARGDKTTRLLGKIQGLTDADMDSIPPSKADFSLTGEAE